GGGKEVAQPGRGPDSLAIDSKPPGECPAEVVEGPAGWAWGEGIPVNLAQEVEVEISDSRRPREFVRYRDAEALLDFRYHSPDVHQAVAQGRLKGRTSGSVASCTHPTAILHPVNPPQRDRKKRRDEKPAGERRDVSPPVGTRCTGGLTSRGCRRNLDD